MRSSKIIVLCIFIFSFARPLSANQSIPASGEIPMFGNVLELPLGNRTIILEGRKPGHNENFCTVKVVFKIEPLLFATVKIFPSFPQLVRSDMFLIHLTCLEGVSYYKIGLKRISAKCVIRLIIVTNYSCLFVSYRKDEIT